MRKTLFLCSAIGLLAAVSPALVRAQFQPPNPDELKMTSDPKAPGADAVYLEINEVANDPMHYQSTYARIKVLTEKGKELATVELPYLKGRSKVADIKGRTIHPDGAVIPLIVKPEDLMVAKSGEIQIGKKVFSLPNVEVGSVLEYSYDIRYDDDEFSSPQWQIQRPYFVHKAHYQFTPFKAFAPNGTPNKETSMYLVDSRGRPDNSLIWWNRLPPDVKMQTSVNGSYSVDVADVAPIPEEEHMPPIRSLLYKVSFYYSYSNSASDFWVSEAKLWSKDVDKFAEPSKAIQDAMNGLIAPTDSDLVKARKLYDAVQALDNTDYSRTKSASEMKVLRIKEAKHAQDTWAQKSGSSEDIAMLYLAMLRAAGLTAYATRVVDREQGVFDPAYLSLEQLDSTLIAISSGGKEILTDPGEKMCPFGTVNWRHSNAKGLGQSPQGVSIVTTAIQQYIDNVTARIGNVNVDAQGGVTGQIDVVMTGQAALHWRQRALEEDDAELKKEFDREALEQNLPEGVEAHVDHFLAINDVYSNLIAVVNLKGSIGTATAKRLILPGFFFETRGRVPFVNEEKRLEPVDMHYGDRVADEMVYHLPEGVTVEGTPQDTNISWPGHAVYIVKSKTEPGQITIVDSLARAFTEAKPEEYQDLRGFYQKIAAADQEQLVLTSAPGSGN
jgi:hypothetical protein